MYPASNGLAEKTVHIVKNIFTKAKSDGQDPYLGILEHHVTDLDCQFSPSQILMGRQLRSILPTTQEALIPKTPDLDLLRTRIRSKKQKSKANYDKSAKPLPLLKIGDTVRIQNKNKTWQPAIVAEKHKIDRIRCVHPMAQSIKEQA